MTTQNDALPSLVERLISRATFLHARAEAGKDDYDPATIELLREAGKAISDCSPRWISTDERNPDDEQTVLGCWQGSSTIEGMMSLTYYAEDAEDGPEVWRDSWGEKTDPPTHWTLLAMPGDALTILRNQGEQA